MTDAALDAGAAGLAAADGFQPDFSNLERLVDGLFDEIERLSAELDGKVSELASQRGLLAQREQELAHQREEMARLSEQWSGQNALLGDVQTEIAGLKTQVAQQLEQMGRTMAASGGSSGGAEWAEKLMVAQRERDQMENELDSLRARNAQLTERIAQQQQQLEQGQGETAAELRRLGVLVEERFGRIVQMAPQAAAGAAQSEAPLKAPPQANPDDPVVNSVVAQLAKLQRDMTRRAADEGSL